MERSSRESPARARGAANPVGGARPTAALDDLSARGEEMQALVRLAQSGPAATAQRRMLQGLFGAAIQAAGPQGSPSRQAAGLAINDDAGLEREAEVMGARALAHGGVATTEPPAAGRPLAPLAMPAGAAPAQRFPLLKAFTRGGVSLSARALVLLLHEAAGSHQGRVQSNTTQNERHPLLAAFMGVRDRGQEGRVTLGGHELVIAKNFYTNLADKDQSNELFAAQDEKVRGGGPSYPQFLSALISWRKEKDLTDAVVAARMRAIMTGTEEQGEDQRLIVPTVVLAGAESMRNARAYGSLLMFLDLVEAGKNTLEQGLGKADTAIDKRQTQGLEPTMAFLGIPARKNKTLDQQALAAALEGLDLDPARLEQLRGMNIPVSAWGGMIPMTGGGTAAMGKADVPKEEVKSKKTKAEVTKTPPSKVATKGPKGKSTATKTPKKQGGAKDDTPKLNLVQAKEASLFIQWLEMKIAPDSELEADFIRAPDATARKLLVALLNTAGLPRKKAAEGDKGEEKASAETETQGLLFDLPALESLVTGGGGFAEEKSGFPTLSLGFEDYVRQHKLIGEDGVDKDLLDSVDKYLVEKHYQPEGALLVVQGGDWTCYIRAVLHHFGAMSKYAEVTAGLEDFDLSRGITVGSGGEQQVRKVIEIALGFPYHVEVHSVMHSELAVTEHPEGEKVRLLHTGAHFSLML